MISFPFSRILLPIAKVHAANSPDLPKDLLTKEKGLRCRRPVHPVHYIIPMALHVS